MTNAYNESYLHDAMNNLGDMVEYAVCIQGIEPDTFFGWFISSGIAAKFEKGNPKYIVGMSGCELAEATLKRTNSPSKGPYTPYIPCKGREYWAGWILAYYQWIRNRRFKDIVNDGLTLSTVLSMYILHEADESKFVEVADGIIQRNKDKKETCLSMIRKARGFTQQELSNASGASLRMVQLYEQRRNDISKAQVNVVVNLAKALGCQIEDLID